MSVTNTLPFERSDIVRKLRERLPELRAKHGVRSLALFGSYARRTPRPDSDVDLLVEFEQTPSLLQVIALEQLLGDLLEARVDLVLRRALRPEVGQSIVGDLIFI